MPHTNALIVHSSVPVLCITRNKQQVLTSLMYMQLAINNVLAPYLGRQFNFSTVKAANFAATFGLMNFWARPLGGFLSDFFGRRYLL